PIAVGVRRIAGHRYVVQTYRGCVRSNTAPRGSRGVVVDRGVADFQRAIGHRDGAAAHAAREVSADGRSAHRHRAEGADAAGGALLAAVSADAAVADGQL